MGKIEDRKRKRECFPESTKTKKRRKKKNSAKKRCRNLPTDVVSEILARLPVKSVIRFKCVCKSWQQLINDNYFRRLHHSHAYKQFIGITRQHGYHNHVALHHYKGNDTFSAIDLSVGVSHISLAFLNDKVMVRASNNGVLCCSSIRDPGIFYVCNPMTQEFRQLPRAPKLRRGVVDDVALACDHSTWTYYVVLGGYPNSNRFVAQYVNQMFCSSTNFWQKIVSPLNKEENYENFHHFNYINPVFLNGKLHFLTSALRMIALDVTTRIWSSISLPEKCHYSLHNPLHLLDTNGSLSLYLTERFWEHQIIQYVFSHEENIWFRVRKFGPSGLNQYPVAHFRSRLFLWDHGLASFLALRTRRKTVNQTKYASMTERSYHVYGYWSTLFPCSQ